MSAEMRSFMEAYGAVHNKEVKESLDNSRDSISEMNLSQLTESDLHEAVEQVLEVWFAEGHTVSECEEIVESILVSSDIPGRQGKIERLLEAFGAVISRVKEKSARTAVESFALYRKGKQVKESWNNKFSHENGNEKLHERLVAADLAGVKNGMLEAYKKLPASKMALKISSKARKQGVEIGQGKMSSIKPSQQIGKMAGVMDTHNPTRSQAKEKVNKASGFSKRSKSVDEDFAGNYEGPLYAQHPDLAEGIRDKDPEKGTKERKERLEKKRDMKLDDHPEYKKEELEVSQIRKDWAEAYKGIYEAKKGDGNLANNYPPYDKVTRGDIIAGAKGEDQMGGKKKKKVTEGSCEGMCKKCGKDPCECPKDEMKEASNWIKGAIKKPGALHKQLGVPEGEKIPEAKLRAAARRSGKIGQRARLALTLKGLKKEDTDWEFLDNLIESEKFTEEQIEKIAKDL